MKRRMEIQWLLPMWLTCGCAYSPTIDILGSYFPAWMACMIIGIGLTLMVRLVLIGLRMQTHLRPKILLYPCMTVFFTLAVWLIFFKN